MVDERGRSPERPRFFLPSSRANSRVARVSGETPFSSRVIPLMSLIRRLGFAASLPLALSAASAQQVTNLSSNPALSSFRFRIIGPASMGGRIDDIEVSESDPNIVYLGYAVGGVWKSTN